MKKNLGIILAIALSLSALLLTIAFQAGWVKANPFKQSERTSDPEIVSYQGQIWEGNVPYHGDGYFKFIILDTKMEMVWSNDGNHDPKPILLPVANGLFSVLLGDLALPNMTSPLTADVFGNPGAVLQVWFSPDGDLFTQMPDQRIASVPYALQAQVAISADSATSATNAAYATNATYADLLDGQHASAFQLRVSGTCPAGQSIREIYSGGNVLCEYDDSMTYTNGTGLLLVGNTFSADPAYLQRRVSTSCVEGSAIKTINSDGSVICESIPKAATFSLSTIDSTGNVGKYSSMAIGTDGLGLISYFDETHGDLKVAHCADINCSSATTTTLDSTGDVGAYTSIAIGTDGLGLISYLDITNYDLKIAHCDNTACSSATSYTLDSTGNIGFYTSIAIGTDGFGLISYYDHTNYDLKVAHCNNTACSSGATSTILDSTGTVGYHTDIAIGTDGFGLISYYDAINLNLKVAHCSNAVCSSATVSILDSTGDVGSDTSITIGRDGLGLISYSDKTNYQLKVAHCANTTCTSAYLTSLNSGEVYGARSSITIGMDGYGVISFWSPNFGSLKVAHCGNEWCTDATVYTLDLTYTDATSTSIVIGGDGYPLISYDDGNTYDLKTAHCSNELCIPINGSYLP